MYSRPGVGGNNQPSGGMNGTTSHNVGGTVNRFGGGNVKTNGNDGNNVAPAPSQPLPIPPGGQGGGPKNAPGVVSPTTTVQSPTRSLPTPPGQSKPAPSGPAKPPPSGDNNKLSPPGQGQGSGISGAAGSIHQRPQSALSPSSNNKLATPGGLHQRPQSAMNQRNTPPTTGVTFSDGNNNQNGHGDTKTTSTTTTAPSLPGNRQAKVLRDYMAKNPEEISLKTGDVVVVLQQNENGHWAGSVAGKVGQFPSDHVELLPLTNPNLESKPVAGGGKVITGVLPRPPKRPASTGPSDSSKEISHEAMKLAKEDPGPLSETEKNNSIRQKVISELMVTENDYLKDLDKIIVIFLFPLKTTAIVPESTIQTIFSNVEIIQNVNKEFYQNLETRMKRHSEISATIPVGDLFKKMGDYFKMYTTYCANHPVAVQTLIKLEESNADFKNFLKICHTDKAVEGFRIYDYLIKPVQRICKYPLLIRELLKFTATDHEDYPLLVEAQKKIDEVVDYINEAKRNAEGNQIVVDIQVQTEGSAIVTPTRHLMKEGVLILHERSTLGITPKPQKVIVFMFNDLLLVVRPKNKKYFEKDKRQKNCFNQKACIRLGSARLIGISVEREKIENCFEIQYTDADDEGNNGSGKTESVILSASSPEEEMTWTKDIKAVIKEYQRKKFFEQQKAKAEAMLLAEQKGGGITRSVSTMIDTSNLEPKAQKPGLSRMQSEPSMNTNIVNNPKRAFGSDVGVPTTVTTTTTTTTPSTPPPAATKTTWSFSSSSTPTRVRKDLGGIGGQRGNTLNN